jgi:hypothetical protein
MQALRVCILITVLDGWPAGSIFKGVLSELASELPVPQSQGQVASAITEDMAGLGRGVGLSPPDAMACIRAGGDVSLR